MKYLCISLLLKFIKSVGLNPLVGWFWPTGHVFDTPEVDFNWIHQFNLVMMNFMVIFLLRFHTLVWSWMSGWGVRTITVEIICMQLHLYQGHHGWQCGIQFIYEWIILMTSHKVFCTFALSETSSTNPVSCTITSTSRDLHVLLFEHLPHTV